MKPKNIYSEKYKDRYVYQTCMSKEYRDRYIAKADKIHVFEIGVDDIDGEEKDYVVIKVYLAEEES